MSRVLGLLEKLIHYFERQKDIGRMGSGTLGLNCLKHDVSAEKDGSLRPLNNRIECGTIAGREDIYWRRNVIEERKTLPLR